MQQLNNVIEFPRVVGKDRRRKRATTYGGPYDQRGYNSKGVLTMAAAMKQSAIRVTKAVRRTPRARIVENASPDRNEKFRQLAMKRVPRALHELQLIANLASHNYKYTPEQADRIIRALEDGLEKVRVAFTRPVREERVSSFSL